MAAVQQPAYTSGPVAAIPITITPMVAAAYMKNPTVVLVQNTGLNALAVEVAFSYDGSTFVVWPTTEFGGPDGNGLPAGTSAWVVLPDRRPPYIRLRAQAAAATTNAQIDPYEADTVRQLGARGRLLPLT